MSQTSKNNLSPPNQPLAQSGAGYLFKGFELVQLKGIRRFVLIPLLINLLLFSGAFYWMFIELEHYMAILMGWLPDWLTWLSTILWPLAVITILVIFSFVFSTAANWLAAPFNGLLSEKVENILLGRTTQNGNMVDVMKDIPRTLGREWRKLSYYLPRAIGFFIISVDITRHWTNHLVLVYCLDDGHTVSKIILLIIIKCPFIL